MSTPLLFASAKPVNLEPKNSIGAKWVRLLEALDLPSTVSGKKVAIKMHLGGGFGYTTVHPFFIRKLVDAVKAAGARDVFVTDTPGAVASACERGYHPETIGCRIVSGTGPDDTSFTTMPINPAFLHLKEVHLASEVLKADALIDLAHFKAHGACGFGGAAKNLSMGCVTQNTRRDLHSLEGGLSWDKDKCSHCKACEENCANHAVSFNGEGEFSVFYHHCKFCQHCVLICPQKALAMQGGGYRDFQKGLALTTAKVLQQFDRKHTLFINFLMNMTIYCDCWGMTTPALVPDAGILAGRDIVAIEQASLDMIKVENLIPGSMPEDIALGGKGHLFERIHGKDPFPIIEFLAEMGWGSRGYRQTEVK